VSADDAFANVARFYDPIMAHVDYGRWARIAYKLAEYVPPDTQHLDVACGTGVLLAHLRGAGWKSVGVDLSRAMLRQGKRAGTACADMRRLPFAERFGFITCLFDSVNFVTETDGLQQAFSEFARVLRPGGVLYFDVVTERMVLKHFVGPEWSEDFDGFQTSWYTHYDRKSRIAQTHVRAGTGPSSVIVERMHPLPVLGACLERAGLDLIARFDVEGHGVATGKSCRVDFIAAKPPHAFDGAILRELPKRLLD
jgi:SAM-dependent methyltransferase